MRSRTSIARIGGNAFESDRAFGLTRDCRAAQSTDREKRTEADWLEHAFLLTVGHGRVFFAPNILALGRFNVRLIGRDDPILERTVEQRAMIALIKTAVHAARANAWVVSGKRAARLNA
jgi:hypothetical protein